MSNVDFRFIPMQEGSIVVLHIGKDVFNPYMIVEYSAKVFWATWSRHSNMRAEKYKSI